MSHIGLICFEESLEKKTKMGEDQMTEEQWERFMKRLDAMSKEKKEFGDSDDPDYYHHKMAHKEGKGKRTHRFRTWHYGDRSIFVGITPYGLATGWEQPYIDRIRAGENGLRFEREIKTSPLDKATKKNLIENMQRMTAEKRKIKRGQKKNGH